MRARVIVPCLVLAFVAPASGDADTNTPPPDACVRLLDSLAFPSRELRASRFPSSLLHFCNAKIGALPRAPRASDQDDCDDGEYAWRQAYDTVLVTLRYNVNATERWSARHRALASVLLSAISIRYARHTIASAHREYAMHDPDFNGAYLLWRLGEAQRALLECADSARVHGARAIASHCRRLHDGELMPARAWAMRVSDVSPRARAFRCSERREIRGYSLYHEPPVVDLMVVLDERAATPRPFDEGTAERMLSVLRRRIATVTGLPVKDDAASNALYEDARIGRTRGRAACMRPLGADEVYFESAPGSVVVRVAPWFVNGIAVLSVDLYDAGFYFDREDLSPTVSIPVVGDPRVPRTYVDSVSIAPSALFFLAPGTYRSEEDGPPLIPVPQVVGTPEGEHIVDEVAAVRSPDLRIVDLESSQRLVHALHVCNGARSDVSEGVRTVTRVDVNGVGEVVGVRARGDDPARVRCAERAFEGYATTCPVDRVSGYFEIEVCSYGGVSP